MTLNELIQQANILKQQGFGEATVKAASVMRPVVKCLSAQGKSTILVNLT